MRPSERNAKKKKVRIPGGGHTLQRIDKKVKAFCGVTNKRLAGSRRSRAHPDVSSPVSREILKMKVRNHVKKE
ncbi:MAG: hypothetical protein GOV01_01010 [Candidatus Altiarchaeota archaeon]|nr:hypothetical protein [Candidatus Altiarchaeota archaeon]